MNQFLQDTEAPEKEGRNNNNNKDVKDEKTGKVCFRIYQGRRVLDIIFTSHIFIYFFHFL